MCLLREIRDSFMDTQVQFAFQVMKLLALIYKKKKKKNLLLSIWTGERGCKYVIHAYSHVQPGYLLHCPLNDFQGTF